MSALVRYTCPEYGSHDALLVHLDAPIGARQAVGQVTIPCPRCTCSMDPEVLTDG